jgi:hypothetical protein
MENVIYVDGSSEWSHETDTSSTENLSEESDHESNSVIRHVSPEAGQHIREAQYLVANANRMSENATMNVSSEEKCLLRSDTMRSEDDSTADGICIICFEPWSNTGAHRLCSLRCGHLFGKVCIETWLKSKNTQSRCPQCNEKARKSDVRIIYAKKLVALDSSERDAALKEVELERCKRKHVEQKVCELALKYEAIKGENESLRRKLSYLEDEVMKVNHTEGRYVLQKSITVCQEVSKFIVRSS